MDDMRVLVRNWRDSDGKAQVDTVIAENALGKDSRARAMDTFRRAFLPRFVNGNPPKAWKILRPLEDRQVPVEILRPVYYWITARNEQLLYDFVCTELFRQGKTLTKGIGTDMVASWIRGRLAACGKQWSNTVIVKVARGMLATLRDFGILEGTAKKRVAPIYMPIESFGYLAFALEGEGATGSSLVDHPDWRLFLFGPSLVEDMFLEADRNKLLTYQAAGKIVRTDFFCRSFEEMADVIAARPH